MTTCSEGNAWLRSRWFLCELDLHVLPCCLPGLGLYLVNDEQYMSKLTKDRSQLYQ